MPKRGEHKPTDSPFAGKVNELCTRMDLTRPELAASLGVSEAALFKWLSGRREPGILYLVRIKAALESLDQGYGKDAVRRFCLQGPESLGVLEGYLCRGGNDPEEE